MEYHAIETLNEPGKILCKHELRAYYLRVRAITKFRAKIYAYIQYFLLYLLRLLRSKRRIHNVTEANNHGEVSASQASFKQDNISIIITTFEARFFHYTIPLIISLRTAITTPIFVVINGNYNGSNNNTALQEFIMELGKFRDIYPIAFSNFHGCSELWNTGIVHADSEYFLILNDDIHVYPKLLKNSVEFIKQLIEQHKLVTINRSFSHFGISSKCIEEVGFFDEHFLGIGEEDRDYFYRYESNYSKEPFNLLSDAFYNLSDQSRDNSIKKISDGKYSYFNSTIQQELYSIEPEGHIQGRYDFPVKRIKAFKNPRPLWEFRKINYKKLAD
jgi:hypothetical protein